MAWTFILNLPQFFYFKNWCKIISQKKSSLTSALSCTEQVVKLPFLSKNCIFRAENDIFSKSSFYTKLISDPKYSFSVGQKYFFLASSKVSIFHQIQPSHHATGILFLLKRVRGGGAIFEIPTTGNVQQ